MFFLPNYEAAKFAVDEHVADLRQAASGGRPMHRTRRHRFGWWGEARRRSTR